MIRGGTKAGEARVEGFTAAGLGGRWRHPWTSGTRLWSWRVLWRSHRVVSDRIGGGTKAGESGGRGSTHLGSAVDGGIPGPRRWISGLGRSYGGRLGWVLTRLEVGRGPERRGVDSPAHFPRVSGRQFRVPARVGGTVRELVDPSVPETRPPSQGRRRRRDRGGGGGGWRWRSGGGVDPNPKTLRPSSRLSSGSQPTL